MTILLICGEMPTLKNRKKKTEWFAKWSAIYFVKLINRFAVNSIGWTNVTVNLVGCMIRERETVVYGM